MRALIMLASIIVAITLGLFLLPTPENTLKREQSSESAPSSLTTQTFKISGANWFDGSQWRSDDIYIKSGKLVSEADWDIANTETLDLSGKYIIPGLIDAHTHTWGNALQRALTFGVTTELDMFTQPSFANMARKSREALAYTKQADFYSSGVLATSPGGHGTEYGIDIPTISKPEQADAFVQERIKEGSDYIKIVYHHKHQYGSFSSISQQTLEALIKAAHKHNKLAVVHVSNLTSARDAVNAGADGLVHIFGDALIDDHLLQQMVDNQTFVIPTLSVIAAMAKENSSEFILANSHVEKLLSKTLLNQINSGFDSIPTHDKTLSIAMNNVRKLHQAGVTLLAGTDAPNPGTAHGVSLHGELLWLVKSGLTPVDAIKAATANVEKYFAVDQRGTLIPGSRADFLVLNKDPRTDIRHTQSIAQIYKNGFPILSDNVYAKTSAQLLSSNTLFDFESGEPVSNGNIYLTATSDSMMQGKSEATIDWIPATCNQSQLALEVNGSVKPGFPFPWSGVMMTFSRDFSQPVNLQNYRGLQFESEGSEGQYRLLVFVAGVQRPFEIPLSFSSQCKNYNIVFADHASIDWSSITCIAWVANKGMANYRFTLDNVELIPN